MNIPYSNISFADAIRTQFELYKDTDYGVAALAELDSLLDLLAPLITPEARTARVPHWKRRNGCDDVSALGEGRLVPHIELTPQQMVRNETARLLIRFFTTDRTPEESMKWLQQPIGEDWFMYTEGMTRAQRIEAGKMSVLEYHFVLEAEINVLNEIEALESATTTTGKFDPVLYQYIKS